MIVTDISKKAEKALKGLGISFSYGYGDAYHFVGIPGKSSVDINAVFTIKGISFIVKGERLLLADELLPPVGKAPEEKDKRFYTKPFLSGEWGGVNCYNVPTQAVAGLFDAFTKLALQSPVVRVRGLALDSYGYGVRMPMLIEAAYSATSFEDGCFEVGGRTLYPKDGVWEEIELRYPD